MAKKQVTLIDIAEACGTSNVTVSKALSGKGGMSDELKEKIIRTAEEMGYVSNKSSLAGGIIGVIIPQKFINPNGSFYWALYNNIIVALKQRGLSCIQENLTLTEEEELIMPAFLRTGNVSGVISLGQLGKNYLKKLSEQKIPLLLLDYYTDDEIEADNIVTNGFLGGYKLTSYLISQGHRDIGFVGTRLATSSIFDRYMGYVKAMLEYDLTPDDKWLIEDRKRNNELFEHITFPDDMPTALVCNCDETAFKVIRDLKAKGYAVPGDISVVGYDNYLISEISDPQITTINVDSKEMAELAVLTLHERILNPSAPTRMQVLSGDLIIKSSVKNRM